MALLRRRTREEIPHAGPYAPGWEVPAHFNFTRDVVDTLAADPARPALTFVDREGIVDRRTFHEISGDAARWAHLLRTRLDRRGCGHEQYEQRRVHLGRAVSGQPPLLSRGHYNEMKMEDEAAASGSGTCT